MFRFKNAAVLLLFAVFTTVASFNPSHLFQQSFKVNSISDKTIYANQSQTYVDQEATKKSQEEAVSKVQNVYEPDPQVFESVQEDLDKFVDSLASLKEQAVTQATGNKSFNGDRFYQDNYSSIYNPFGFTKTEMKQFYDLPIEDVNRIKEYDQPLKKVFEKGVDEDQLETIKRQFVETNTISFLKKDVHTLLVGKLVQRIVPNKIFNQEKTDLAKEEAKNNVEDVLREIQNGEAIVTKGEKITSDQMIKLKALGLIQTDVKHTLFLKQLPYALLLFVLFHFYCFKFYENSFNTFKNYLFVLLLVSFSLFLSTFLSVAYFSHAPFLFALMVLVSFWGRKFVVFAAIIIGLLLSVKTGNDYNHVVFAVVSGILLALSFNRRGTRISIIVSGFIVGLTLALLDVIIALSINQENIIDWQSIFPLVFSAFSASVLTVGLLPLFEKFLGIVTPAKLYELSDPTQHPLLKRLRRDAYGTYSHSDLVSTFAEMAAEAISADSLLLRAGALFHDVGKLKNVEYFIENSTPELNPHQSLDPLESAKIILDHPHESIRICRQYKVPEQIIRLIACHHSDSVLYHLYAQAKKKDENVDINLFKYTTPTPKTKEEGILLLADSTEAYSRFLIEKGVSKEELASSIRKMIYEKIEKGDLRDCMLTMKEINLIIQEFVTYLNKSHSRIDYNTSNS